MKKILISCVATYVVAFVLAGCGTSEIDKVKNGTFKYDQSISVGDAIENKPYCTDVKWSSQKEGGRLVVSARCEINKEMTQKYIKDKLRYYNEIIAESTQLLSEFESYNEPMDIAQAMLEHYENFMKQAKNIQSYEKEYKWKIAAGKEFKFTELYHPCNYLLPRINSSKDLFLETAEKCLKTLKEIRDRGRKGIIASQNQKLWLEQVLSENASEIYNFNINKDGTSFALSNIQAEFDGSLFNLNYGVDYIYSNQTPPYLKELINDLVEQIK